MIAKQIPKPDPIVTTDSGRLRGIAGPQALRFQGVPYAGDTSGIHRFLAPQPVAPWRGVRDAFRPGPRSPQAAGAGPRSPVLSWLGGDDTPMSEDCCVLNVYTPGLEVDARRPVMVYLHGGSYTYGSGGEPVLEGSRLAAFGDVVVVTVNHRLNVFGYTCLGTLDAHFGDAGNAGQLDLVAALHWVRRNIGAFGGDPGNVTLFGQSGGGGKVMALLGMPAAQGLFHRAIDMSGPWHDVPAADTRQYVDRLLAALGIAARQLTRLREVPVDALLRARASALRDWGFDAARPVIDGVHLPAPVMSPAGLAMHAPVPLLLGTVATEASFYFARDPRNFNVDAAQVKARIRAQYGLDEAEAQALMAAYREDTPAATPAEILAAFAGDMRIRAPMLRAVLPKADGGAAPVYVYDFAWKSALEGGRWGAPHTVDIPFAFLNLDCASALTDAGPPAHEAARNLAAAFVAFARHGDPNNAHMPHWPPYRSAQRASMVIAAQCHAAVDYRGAARVAAARLESLDGPTLDRGPLFNYAG